MTQIQDVKKEYQDLLYQDMMNDFGHLDDGGCSYIRSIFKEKIHKLIPSCCNKEKRYKNFIDKYSEIENKPETTNNSGKVNHILTSCADFINCFLCIKGYSLSSFYGAIVVILIITSMLLQTCSQVLNVTSLVSPENSSIFLIISVAVISISQILISISAIFKKLSDYEKDVAITGINGKALSKGVLENILENRSKLNAEIIEESKNKEP